MPKIRKDPKIQVDSQQAKIIAEVICAEIGASRNENAKVYELTQRCEDQYHQISKWTKAGKVCNSPWKGAADYFIPLSEWIVDAVWSRVVNVLFADEPTMTAEGAEKADKQKEDGVTDFVAMIMTEKVRLRQNSEFFFKQMIKIPMAVMKYAWQQDYDSMIVEEEAITFSDDKGNIKYLLKDDPDLMLKVLEYDLNGYELGEKENVWVMKDVPLVDAPQLEYIQFSDYVWTANTKKGQKPYWEGDRFYMTLNQMMLKVKQKKFRADAVEKVKNSLDVGWGGSVAEAAVRQRSTLFETYHWYGRLPFNNSNQIDFNDPDAIEQEVYCVVSFSEKELLSISNWEYRRIPKIERVYIRGMFEETNDFYGRSLLTKLYQTQRELNDLHNTIMNNAMLCMQKIFVKKKTLQGTEWEKPKVFPGAMWEEQQQGDIRVLEVGDVKAVAWELEASFINFAERLSNISVYQTGTARQGGAKTKGEVERTVYEGNIGMDKFIGRCHEVLRTIHRWTVDYYYDRMPDGLERRIRGDSAEQMVFARGEQNYWQTDDIAGQFDFTWNGTSLTSSKAYKIQVQNDIEERYLPHPMVAGNLLSVWEILKRGFEIRDEDWQKYLPPREAIVHEMQLMEQKEKAVKQSEEMEKNLPRQAVQKAIEMGVPAGQAEKFLNRRERNVGEIPSEKK